MKLKFTTFAFGLAAALIPSLATAQEMESEIELVSFESSIGCTDPGCTDAGCDGCDSGCTDAACDDGGCTDGWLSCLRNPHCTCLLCRKRPMWASFDSMLVWGKGRSAPPLVTTSPNGTAQADAGVLGLPTTSILLGGSTIGNELAAGARADFGIWMDDYQTLGVGARVWGVRGDADSYINSSSGDPIIARPFFDVGLGSENSVLIAFPNVSTGSISARTESDVLSTEAYVRSAIWGGRGYNIDFIGGYHFNRLDDSLSVFASSTALAGGALPVGTQLDYFDAFDARNEFHGGVFGVLTEVRRDCWTISSLMKLSVGNMNQEILINGRTTVTAPNNGPSATSAGGLYAMPTNIGSYERDRTAIIPEVIFNVGYAVTDSLKLTMGYTAVYWNNVVLAGDQIDRNINTSQAGNNPLIGPPLPAFRGFRETDYWLHGLTFGAELQF